MIVNITNQSAEAMVCEVPYLRLSPGAAIANSELAGNLTVDKLSCINRCEIGKYFGLGCFSYVSNSRIGRFCTFGARVSVGAFSHPTDWLSIHEVAYRDTRHFYGESVLAPDRNIAPNNAPTVIGNDVWIGDNASVRTGVQIGNGAIVGMGAVISKNVPPYAIVVGNPGRILRYRFDHQTVASLLELQWWRLDMADLCDVDFSDVGTAITLLRQRNVRGQV